jgi:hypothetical protein
MRSSHPPPLLPRNEREQSVAIVETMRGAGCRAEPDLCDGPGNQHGIWRDDRLPLCFYPHLENAIATFLRETL